MMNNETRNELAELLFETNRSMDEEKNHTKEEYIERLIHILLVNRI